LLIFLIKDKNRSTKDFNSSEYNMIKRKCRQIDKSFFINHSLLNRHTELYTAIIKIFDPDDDVWIVKAPGRVNLIGEHTDYNMGPVLPCAIDREIVFCLRQNKNRNICVLNIFSEYEAVEFSLDQMITPYSRGNWGNYIKAGVKGILEQSGLSGSAGKELLGFDAIVSSTLPVAAGISSSSALVVISALSLLIVNELNIDKLKLAEICAEAEHFVGTAGGGMDQAASLMGEKDSFLKIDFNPLRVQTISAPKDITLILFHSLVNAEKSQTVRKEYNRRVLECKMGIDLFNQFLKLQIGSNFKYLDYIGQIGPDYLDQNPQEIDVLVQKFIRQLKNAYKLDELLALLNASLMDVELRYHNILRGDKISEPQTGFRIKGRFRHVYTECQRVDKMIKCIQENDIDGMGQLLGASHISLSNDYEVSTEEVNNLHKHLQDSGASGARLVGAGFGGMILALSRKDKTDYLINEIRDRFYKKNSITDISDYIIPCVPSEGASTIQLS
jgi:N-acetylgalactosamine kinase